STPPTLHWRQPKPPPSPTYRHDAAEHFVAVHRRIATAEGQGARERGRGRGANRHQRGCRSEIRPAPSDRVLRRVSDLSVSAPALDTGSYCGRLPHHRAQPLRCGCASSAPPRWEGRAVPCGHAGCSGGDTLEVYEAVVLTVD